MLVIVAIASSCKKYEEGPCISFRSPEKRLFGHYAITSYTINGEESLSLFNDSLSTKVEFVRYWQYSEISFLNDGKRNDGKDVSVDCSCGFDKKHTNFYFSRCVGDIGLGPFSGLSKDIKWEILKLTNKELKLKTLYNNKEYVVVMEKNN